MLNAYRLDLWLRNLSHFFFSLNFIVRFKAGQIDIKSGDIGIIFDTEK